MGASCSMCYLGGAHDVLHGCAPLPPVCSAEMCFWLLCPASGWEHSLPLQRAWGWGQLHAPHVSCELGSQDTSEEQLGSMNGVGRYFSPTMNNGNLFPIYRRKFELVKSSLKKRIWSCTLYVVFPKIFLTRLGYLLEWVERKKIISTNCQISLFCARHVRLSRPFPHNSEYRPWN